MLWGTQSRVTTKPDRLGIENLYRITPGSAGLDLCAAAHTVLTPDMGMQAIPTGVFGPLPKGTVGLIIGRSSWTMKGLSISPGVIDADYTGEIKIMACAPLTLLAYPLIKELPN